MITESSARARMPVVESNASSRTSRCTPFAGATVNVFAPASCWISAAHTPAAFTTTRADTSKLAAASPVLGRHPDDPAVRGGADARDGRLRDHVRAVGGRGAGDGQRVPGVVHPPVRVLQAAR